MLCICFYVSHLLAIHEWDISCVTVNNSQQLQLAAEIHMIESLDINLVLVNAEKWTSSSFECVLGVECDADT